jgi:hypothetical protein
VRNLKLLVLAFAALGLGLLISDFEHFKELATDPLYNGGGGLIAILGFVVPLAMGLLGMIRPPFMRGHAVASVAGFASIAIKGRIWDALPKLMDYPTKGKLGLVAVVAGIVVSALAIVRPEETD